MNGFHFLIIGAGIAGLSVASRLARHGSVLVCEAEEAPGFHASGRSAAFAHFDMDSALVRALTAASLPFFEEPSAQPHPALFIALRGQEEALDRLERHYHEWAPQARRVNATEAQSLVPVLRTDRLSSAGALLDPEGRKLDAHAMLEGHRKSLLEAGGRIMVRSPVTGMDHDGRRWIVQTPQETVSAKIIINAAGAWADKIAKLAGASPIGITPLRRTVITFDLGADSNAADWPFTKTVGPGFYIEPEGRSRLLACPMDEHPSDPCDAQPEEEDIARAAWNVEQATTLKIRHVTGKWAGLRSFAPDRMPVVGFDPAAPNFFWLAGQGGFGLQTSPAMTLAAEALATGSVWPEELRRFGIVPESLSPLRF